MGASNDGRCPVVTGRTVRRAIDRGSTVRGEMRRVGVYMGEVYA